ncbi:suppressor of tub2 mutation [Malassezia caprae]|uniref:Suppressor of tub2 mutation n=1 Tax=Malassezia caprae TaxID=1381934 RepID=A0AAF0ECK2_9BASI|nr:suppressor of tub2 mutation [Malassezia caprae]
MPDGRPTELALIHAVDTAPDAPALTEALGALEASWAKTGAVHDMDVALMALHPHIASPHAGVRDAALRALETMLGSGSLTTLSMLTLVRTCVPAVLVRLHDAPRAETLLRHMAQIVYGERAKALAVRESDAPHTAFERIVRDDGLAATSPHVRTSVLRVLPILQQDGARLPVRMYLTELADNLQHADAHVRGAAKAAILALLHDAPPALKSELRDELSMRDVHRAVLDEITHGLGAAKAPLPDELTSFADDVKPVYLLSRYDLDHAFQQAAQALEGKETELNWQPREKAVVAMRGMIRAEVPPELVAPFLAHIREAQDGLLKTLASLRTTLSMHTIALIRQLALTFGTHLDPTTIDAFLTALLRMAGFTKKIVATASQVGASTILACVPMRHAYWHMLQAGLQDKSAATRVHMCKHIQVVLSVHAAPALEHHGGREAAAHCLGKALVDPHVEVRAAARDTFRTFYTLWKEDGEHLLTSLPPPTRKQVAAGLEQGAAPSPRRTPSRTGPSRAILAAKRAALAQSPRETRRMPRESVWHPSLVGGPDASTDLLEPDSPWRGDDTAADRLHGLAAQDAGPSTPVRHAQAEVATPSEATSVAHGASPALATPPVSAGARRMHRPPLSAGARSAASPGEASATPTSAPVVPSSSFAFRAPWQPSAATPVRKSVVAPTALPQTAASWFLTRCERCMQSIDAEAPSWDEALAHDTPVDKLQALSQALSTPPSVEQVHAALDAVAPCLPEETVTESEAWFWALLVLYRLAPHVRGATEEGAWLTQVLRAVHADAAHSTLAMGAGRAMVDAWLAQQTEAAPACERLVHALGSPEAQDAARLALALYAMEQLVPRMPMAEPGAELHAMVPYVHTGLRHGSTPVRRASVAVLVQAHIRWDEVHGPEGPGRRELALFASLTPREERLVEYYLPRAAAPHASHAL